MGEHTTRWQDDWLAGIECDGVSDGMTLDSQDSEPKQCQRCGAWLLLKWDVRVVVVKPSTVT
jgi:hypothetical protein